MPLPSPAWSTNQDRNLHFQDRHQRVKTWQEATILHYWLEMKGDARAQPPGVVQITIPFKDRRRRDPHNYCGTVLKAVIDGLVMAGAWPDDTPEYVGHREPLLVKDPELIVVVEITPMELTYVSH